MNRQKSKVVAKLKHSNGSSKNVINNKQSKEFTNCRKWLSAQKKLKTKSIPVDDIDDAMPGTSYPPIGHESMDASADSEVLKFI